MATTTSPAGLSRLPEPPAAPGLPLLGSALAFLTAPDLPMDFLGRLAARQGDLARFNIGRRPFYLLSHPDLVYEVLVRRFKDFDKLPVPAPPAPASGSPAEGNGQPKPTSLARFLGAGILTASHEAWRPQRQLIQPLMHTQHIRRYAGQMVHFGEQMLERWSGQPERDIHADMLQVTMWIIADTMFGMDVTQTPALQAAADKAQAITIGDVTSPLPAWLARDRQAAEVNGTLTALVRRFMRERRAQDRRDRHDLLSLLMETRDEDGRPMSDEFVRDNILTLFFAGHETTANTLTWAFYYLDQNPDTAAKLHQELDQVLGGRAPGLDDLPRLPYTLMVIKETMRIEPTVAVIPRFVVADTELGGYRLRRNGVIFIPLYLLHRDPRWWPRPEQFDPARFSPENEPNIPRYAYLPFGAGPRICIGNHFSLMEAQILLALIAGRYRLSLAPGARVRPLRLVTTSPQHGLPMRVEARARP